MPTTIVSCEEDHTFVIGDHGQNIIRISHAQEHDTADIEKKYSDDLLTIFNMFAFACPHLEACKQLRENDPDDKRCLAMIGFRG